MTGWMKGLLAKSRLAKAQIRSIRSGKEFAYGGTCITCSLPLGSTITTSSDKRQRPASSVSANV